MSNHNPIDYIAFELPACVGDVLLWGERCFNRATGEYLGHRLMMAEVTAINGDDLTLTVLSCYPFDKAASHAAGESIDRPATRIIKGQPRREWWSDEEERQRLCRLPAAPAPAPKPPKP